MSSLNITEVIDLLSQMEKDGVITFQFANYEILNANLRPADFLELVEKLGFGEIGYNGFLLFRTEHADHDPVMIFDRVFGGGER